MNLISSLKIIFKPLTLSIVVRFSLDSGSGSEVQSYECDLTIDRLVVRIPSLGYSISYLRTFVVIIFRLLPAIFLGDGIYGDEQDEFECVGTQPGCRNMCFTEFSPMQPPRMWCLQILLSCLPPVIFNFYAARQTAQERIKILR